MISRRSFLTLASGLLVPYEPQRVYSFLPGWRLVSRWVFDSYIRPGTSALILDAALADGRFRCPAWTHPDWQSDPGTAAISPDNLLDVQKSAEAYGYPAFTVLS